VHAIARADAPRGVHDLRADPPFAHEIEDGVDPRLGGVGGEDALAASLTLARELELDGHPVALSADEPQIGVVQPLSAAGPVAAHADGERRIRAPARPVAGAQVALADDLAQRPEGKTLAGLWEFPGGKLEPGEHPEQTLIRELHEEIGITVSEACLAPLTFASHAYEDFHLLMPLYICRRWEGDVIAREGQGLAWVRANKLRDYKMPPADIPLIPHLIDLLM